VLLYVPWGYFWARQRPDPTQRVRAVVALAAALSIVTEISQVYAHGRFPSATDVTCNLVGAFIGAEYARRHHQ
jgi:VanZ family protein